MRHEAAHSLRNYKNAGMARGLITAAPMLPPDRGLGWAGHHIHTCPLHGEGVCAAGVMTLRAGGLHAFRTGDPSAQGCMQGPAGRRSGRHSRGRKGCGSSTHMPSLPGKGECLFWHHRQPRSGACWRHSSLTWNLPHWPPPPAPAAACAALGSCAGTAGCCSSSALLAAVGWLSHLYMKAAGQRRRPVSTAERQPQRAGATGVCRCGWQDLLPSTTHVAAAPCRGRWCTRRRSPAWG